MRCLTVLGAFALLLAAPVQADPVSETLFTAKHWVVEVVGFDDGTYGCMAQVSNDDGSESFSLWSFEDSTLRIQFYSAGWQFDNGTADLEVQVDRRTPWTLTEAELYENSVLFDLPDNDDSVRFVVEVANGSRLYLRNDDGEDVQDYSLAGSSASIGALIDCGDVIQAPDANPFQ